MFSERVVYFEAKTAIVRAPAQVLVTDPRYEGQIIFNFGGPDGSDTALAVEYGQALQTSFDAAYSYGSETYVSDHFEARCLDLVSLIPGALRTALRGMRPSRILYRLLACRLR